MTDEQVYKDARKDEARRQAYKLLASLREVGVGGQQGVGECALVAVSILALLIHSSENKKKFSKPQIIDIRALRN